MTETRTLQEVNKMLRDDDNSTRLLVEFNRPMLGYWDGGKKSKFEFTINYKVYKDSKGYFTKIGSWEANYWFMVSVGKTVTATLSYAMRALANHFRKNGYYVCCGKTLKEWETKKDSGNAVRLVIVKC